VTRMLWSGDTLIHCGARVEREATNSTEGSRGVWTEHGCTEEREAVRVPYVGGDCCAGLMSLRFESLSKAKLRHERRSRPNPYKVYRECHSLLMAGDARK
jgi:hypothetical protein